MPLSDLGSVRLHYQILGKGRPIVFVNGWTSSCQYWMPVAELLKSKYLCLLYDYRGVGRSQIVETDVGVDIDEHAEDLHQLILNLGLEDVNVVAHGLGCWAATLAARRHPQDFATLTIVSPEIETLEEKDKEKPDMPSVWQQTSLILKDLASIPLLRNVVTRRYNSAPEPYRTLLCEDFAKTDRRVAYHMLASCMGKENRERFFKAFAEIPLPIMLVRGSEDKLAPETDVREIYTLIKSGCLATIRGCGHLPMLEFTKEFSKLLSDFFDKQK
ncbi:MAG: alpha/beta hydrolase [Blastocatellia bacterium]|nr:alpha/beta hydrolase [Blastocatellia bacterium]